jgi:tetratricopeptide (TPR) repeat protein
LVAARLGIESDTLKQQAHKLFQSSQGNPYFLDQLLEGFDAATGQFQLIPLDQIVDRKLQRLPTAAAALLNAIAIAGQAASPAEVAQVAGQSAQGFATLTHMRSERLVRLIGSGDQQLVDTWHDKIRETVLNSLGEEARREAHRKYGEILEGQENITAAQLWETLSEDATNDVPQTHRVFDLAHHFYMAKDQRAFVYQLLAGEQALRNYAIEEASVFYERAQELLPENAPDSVQYRLFLAVGRVMLWKNLPERSIEACEKAEKAADNATSRARACAGIGHVFHQIGYFDQGIEHYDRALILLGSPRRRTLTGTLWYVLKMLLQILFVPAKYLRGGSNIKREHAVIQHDICLRLEFSIAEKSFLSIVAVNLRDSRESLRTGDAHLIAHGYAQAAGLFSAFGAAWFGNLLLRRAGRIESRLNDPAIRGAFLSSEGIARYWGGDLEGAEASLVEGCGLV